MRSMPVVRCLVFTAGAIGSAEWSGVKLRDVLRFAGFDEDNSDGVAHVQFEGLDSDSSGTCYGASIPIDKAMGSHGDVLLAFSMNGRYRQSMSNPLYALKSSFLFLA